MLAKDVMNPVVEVLHVDHDVREALSRFKASGLSHLLVLDGDQIVGYLTRSLISSLDAETPGIAGEFVGNLMDTGLRSCRLDDNADDVRAILENTAVSMMAVVDRTNALHGWIAADDFTASDDTDFGPDTRVEQGDETGGRAKPSAQGDLHVYSEKPRLKTEEVRAS